ncbi:hypothetical protein CAPN010_14330 [Capnocytophaga cynodegmi]|uniref:hypothetical protein n=1 Tax=Capnocytophaga cynodegmi TaxID=28189 RepID=UPI001EE200AF|nr:hypothetical protein [Capnocytophaga cynodegmi]GJQ07275.1 hypothetical protein CAPN010_14330 [Capnocytophaga cynodegmi]
MITIEFEAPKFEKCNCCNANITQLTRFVYQDNEAFAYYYAKFEDHNDPKVVECLVVLCEWDENNEEIIKKTGFPLKIWAKDDNYNITLTNKDECPWKNIPEVEILDREQSLNHLQKSDVFHITDHIVAEDMPIIRYFEGK